jgi:hypothetical protein
MNRAHSGGRRLLRRAVPLAGLFVLAVTLTASATQAGPKAVADAGPTYGKAVAFDVSPPLSSIASAQGGQGKSAPRASGFDADRDVDVVLDSSARRASAARPQSVSTAQSAASVPATNANFEGLSNQDNFNVFGFRVNPPDPVGDVGPNHYVEMINLVFAVYAKNGTKLLGPVDTGTLWSGFAIDDCTDPSGDPIVLHDQTADRWILSQFTTRGLADPTLPFYNCVAVSTTSDPTGSYYRYAFSTGFNFPDYPKYGIYGDTYINTSREFGPNGEYGIGVYGFERAQMLKGNPNARSVRFFIDGNNPDLLPLVGDGLLPPDMDGVGKPRDATAALVGTQDDDYVYGATSDAVNIWEFHVNWGRQAPTATLKFAAQLPVTPFDSNFPCAPTARDCLPQPGIANPAQYLDVLSYRQRPIWRLAYRKMQGYESMVTNQSVESSPGIAGTRWYEIQRVNGVYSIRQQGTIAPSDGIHRWMGSIAQDKRGNMAVGYSVVNGTDVYPGIRYTGRLATDAPGTMPQGEGVIVNGTGVQTTTNSRWGDYTSLNMDPTDDCTFWYVNEYYTAEGQASSPAGWQTRIASFKFPNCNPNG